MEDVVYLPGEQSIFVAQLEKDLPVGLPDALEGTTVTFWNGSQHIGSATTDDEGRAQMVADIGGAVPKYVKARARSGLQRVEVEQPVRRWERSRVIIAVDVDHTIAETDYEGVLIDDIDTKSKPIPGSIEVLNAMSRKYHLMYVTARPIFLFDETRQWLKMHGYPQAPLVMGPSASALVDQAELKENLLSWRRDHLPNLLIGIGDKETDAEAYAAVGMLSLILAPVEDESDVNQVFIVKDWVGIESFFNSNAGVLSDAGRLENVIRRGAIDELEASEDRQRFRLRAVDVDDDKDDHKDDD